MKIYRILLEPEYFRKLIRAKKVAAYCRVSSFNEEQLSSYRNQIEYYEAYIIAHKDWELVKVYAYICSGRKNIKMLQFQEMMSECRKGNIDLILMKSMSRMGRNTLEVVGACRELKSLNVDIYFENQKIYLSNSNSEFILTLLSAFYQAESENLSYNIKWGIRKGFQSGKTKFASKTCYGYSKGMTGRQVTNDGQLPQYLIENNHEAIIKK